MTAVCTLRGGRRPDRRVQAAANIVRAVQGIGGAFPITSSFEIVGKKCRDKFVDCGGLL
jgi:hypothetical protein